LQPKTEEYPDFAALRRSLFGKKKSTATDLVSEQRASIDRYADTGLLVALYCQDSPSALATQLV
jgi:hypothetical protein